MNQSDEIFRKYWLTITICAIFFVLMLVFFILNWVKKNKGKKTEDAKSYCPDYWTIASESKHSVTCVPPSTITGSTAKESCLKNNKTWKISKDKKSKCQWAKNCEQQWYGIWDDNNSSC